MAEEMDFMGSIVFFLLMVEKTHLVRGRSLITERGDYKLCGGLKIFHPLLIGGSKCYTPSG
mgnify:CR=1 FL=1